MSLEANKQVVREWNAHLSAGAVKAALELLAKSATWWVAGTSAAGTTYTREAFCELIHGFTGAFKTPLRMTTKTLTAEEDRVAAQIEGWGQLPDGRIYNNAYHVLYIVRDGKIQQGYEYYNTLYAAELFGQAKFD